MNGFSRLITIILFTASISANVVFAEAPEKLDLAQCLKLALDQNSEIKIAREDLKTAKAQTVAAWSTIFPKLTLENSYTRMHSYSQDASMEQIGAYMYPLYRHVYPTRNMIFSSQDYQEAYSLKLTAQQIIFGTHVKPAIDAAAFGMELAEKNMKNKESGVTYETKSAYFAVLKAQEMLRSTQESKKLIEQLLTQTRELKNAGLATNADVLRIQLQLLNIEQAILGADTALAMSRAKLNTIIDIPVDSEVTLEPCKTCTYNLYEKLDNTDLVKKAMKNRLELDILDLTVKLYDTQAAAQGSAAMPLVFLAGSYGAIDTDTNAYDFKNNEDWMLTLAASWKFYDGGETSSKVDETKAAINKTKEQKRSLLKGIELEIKLICYEMNSSIAAINAAQKEVELATEIEKTAHEKFLAGAATNLEVIDSQTSLIRARSNLINAEYDFEIARAKLDKALGVQS